MKSKWYDIYDKKQKNTRINVEKVFIGKMIKIKPIIKNGLTTMLDYNGEVHNVFKARKIDFIFIWFRLLLFNLKQPTKLIVREFKPYGQHYIYESIVHGTKNSIFYDVR